MATGEQLKAFFKSLESGDEEGWYSIALQMAAHEARAGHANLARELRDLIEQIRSRNAGAVRTMMPTSLAQPRGELRFVCMTFAPETKTVSLRQLCDHRLKHARRVASPWLRARRRSFRKVASFWLLASLRSFKRVNFRPASSEAIDEYL